MEDHKGRKESNLPAESHILIPFYFFCQLQCKRDVKRFGSFHIVHKRCESFHIVIWRSGSASSYAVVPVKCLVKFPFVLQRKVRYTWKSTFKCNQSFQACFKDIFKICAYKNEVALATVTIGSKSNYFHKILRGAFSLLIGMCKYLALSYTCQKYSSLILSLRHRNPKVHA